MFRILKLTFVALLLISCLNSPGFGQDKYLRANLWEKEINAFLAFDKRTPPKKGAVLFVGSSSIRGWRTLADDFPGFETLNRGFGGSHLEDVIHYAPQIVYPYKPKLIVLYAGENDLTAGKPVDSVFADFRRFISDVHEKSPKTRVIYISAKPSPARWKLAPVFSELNSLIKREIEKDRRLHFVDIWTPMLSPDGKPNEAIFLADKLHMNADGYRIWRQTLLPAVQSGIKGNFR